VSVMSHRGVSIEEIAHLVGHASTGTAEVVYRRELRPVITTGAEIMGEVFGLGEAGPLHQSGVVDEPHEATVLQTLSWANSVRNLIGRGFGRGLRGGRRAAGRRQ
jgi:hypothetical protein